MDTSFSTAPTKNISSVKGRLKEHLYFWKNNLEASSFVLNIINHGYILPFSSVPPPFYAKNNLSSLKHHDFVDKAILELVGKRLVKEVSLRPYCCNPLTVAEGKKLRLVLDLRHVNQYLMLTKFKYEDLKTIAEMLDEGDFFTTFDLTSGYHHVDIFPEHCKFLGFEWTFANGVTKYFEFLVLAFGLATACYVFTKLLRPLIKKWRNIGIKSVIYLDDGINAHSSYKSCKIATDKIVHDLEQAGFIINIKKSNLEPQQEGEWLGTILNTKNMTFYIPERKIKKMLKSISDILSYNITTPKELSKIAGTLSSMHLSLGPVVRLFTRAIYSQIQKSTSWYQRLKVDECCKFELNFWRNNVNKINGYSLKPKRTTSQILFTDASQSSYGGFILERLERKICRGNFNLLETTRSSTERELLAIKYSLKSFSHLLCHESVNVRTDNLSASRILEIGSAKPWLNSIAVDIFKLCVKHDINIHSTWIPREQNVIADYYSKLKDTDDWSIDNNSFKQILKIYGPVDYDRFADHKNKKVYCFNSKYYCPGSKGVDAFTKDWSQSTLNWLCPPIKFITACIDHLRLCKAKGILIVPEWPSSNFWPKLFYNDSVTPGIQHVYVFEPFYISNSNNNVFNGFVNFKTLALYLNFTV